MKKGFTLSELLIALSIIGVITILTLPKIIAGVQHKTLVSQLESVDSAFKNTVRQAMIDERVTSLADTTYGTSAGDFLKKYFKVASDCNTSHSACLASSYKSLDGKASISTNSMLDDTFYCVSISSGAVICSTIMGQDTGDTHGNSTVVVDVNGNKDPNTNGRDLFSFNIYTDGTIGNSYDSNKENADGTTCSNNAANAGYGGACYSKIVTDRWKMNY